MAGRVLGRVIQQKQVTVNDLIAQCNIAVANMQNERTGTARNRRMLIFNCALGLRQLVDTLTARDQEIAALKAGLDIATDAIPIPIQTEETANAD